MGSNVISVPVTHQVGPISYTEKQSYSFGSLGGLLELIGFFVFIYGLGSKEKKKEE